MSHDPEIFVREEEAAILEPLPEPTAGRREPPTANDPRPGVSEEFLKARGVRRVEAEEAEALLGFVPKGGGRWIPTSTVEAR